MGRVRATGSLRMLFGFFGRVSAAPQLRDALDVGSQRVRGIAQRVSSATVQNQSGFAINGTTPSQPAAVDIEQEMTNLADAQLRYETTAKLLEKAYAQIRLSVSERA